MKRLVEKLIKGTPAYYMLLNWRARSRDVRAGADWERAGRPGPPPHIVKQRVLQAYAKQFKLRVLVESGTYLGDMVAAMKRHFDRIYSIELDKELYESACARFKGAGRIQIIRGDSGVEMEHIVKSVARPALFWLDGHYSAGVTARGETSTPIYDELRHILPSLDAGHVVIIDDARSFTGTGGYPTLAALSDFARSILPAVDISVECDMIRITPRLGETGGPRHSAETGMLASSQEGCQ